jgi:hypothetical protein
VASDGRNDVRADGSVIQRSTSHRGLARVVLAVLGALLIFVGALLPFVTGDDRRAVDLSVGEVATLLAAEDLVEPLRPESIPFDLEQVVSVGLGLMVLAGLVLLGLTGSSGRLTRYAAVFAAAVVVATLVGWAVVVQPAGPGQGAIAILGGCVLGYVGGVLARR